MISVLPFISSVCMVQWTLVHPGIRRELWYSKVLPRHHSRVGAGRYQVCRALNHSRIVATPVIGNYCGLSMFLLLIFHFYWTWKFDHRHSSKKLFVSDLKKSTFDQFWGWIVIEAGTVKIKSNNDQYHHAGSVKHPAATLKQDKCWKQLSLFPENITFGLDNDIIPRLWRKK